MGPLWLVEAAMKHLLNLFLFTALTSGQVSFGDGPAQRPRPGPPLNRPPPPGNRPSLDGPPRPPRPFQPGGRPPRPVGFPNRPRPQGPFQGQQGQRPSQGQRPFQGEQGQRPNLGGPGNQNTAGGGKTTTVTIRQSWSQEPQGLDREAALKLPQVLPTDGR